VTEIQILALLGAVLAALAVLASLREVWWRRRIASELTPEVALGILSERDLAILQTWRRFRGGWFSGSRERRAFCQIAGQLAHAKEAQRRAAGESSRLLQVQVLTLRTRLRKIQAPTRWTSASDAGSDLEPVAGTGDEGVEHGHLENAQE
jgi:hypothetical protein